MPYGCTRGPIWDHVRADMGLCEWAVMGLAWQALHFITYPQLV